MNQLRQIDRKRCASARLFFVLMVAVLSGGVFHPANVSAQDRTVRGIVIDENSKPLIGASVVVAGTGRGIATNGEGRYVISASAKDTLVFSMLGYQTVKMVVGSRTVVDVSLKESDNALETVVVIGYGSSRVQDLTGSVDVVNMDDVMKAPVVSVDQALAGRIAGVNVSSVDGQPGNGSEIIIRGASSLTQSNAPLYVIDGFPMEIFNMSDINPSDIASIVVLKDASSTAIYGSRGANGVILIDTRQGKEGKAQVSYNGSFGLQTPAAMMDLMEPYDYVKLMLELNADNTERFLTRPGLTLEDYRNIGSTDMQSKVFRTASQHNHSVSVSGGTKTTKYIVSGSYAKQDGVIVGSDFEKYQARFSLIQKFGKKVSIQLSGNYSTNKRQGQVPSNESNPNSTIVYRTWSYPAVWVKGLQVDDIETDESGDVAKLTPDVSARNEVNTNKWTSITGNVSLNYDIHNNLRLMIRGGSTRSISRLEQFHNSLTYKGYPRPANADTRVTGLFSETTRYGWMNENTLTWSNKYGPHNFKVLGGFTIEQNKSDRYQYNTTLIPDESLGLSGIDEGIPGAPIASLSSNRMMSFLGRFDYQYLARYYLTLTFRADGSSKFAPGRKWGRFPAVAVSWNMHNEPFMKRQKVIYKSKFRFGYGVTGNNRVSDFAYLPSIQKKHYYSMNNATPSIASTISSFGNSALKWETTTFYNLAYELGLFKQRIDLTFELYRKNTDDLLLRKNMPYSSGMATETMNIGSIRNDGFELTLNTINIRTPKFQWNSDFNISFNRNRILKLADRENNMLSNVGFGANFSDVPLYIARVGGPAASFFGLICDGVYQLSDFDMVDGNYVLKSHIADNGGTSGKAGIKPGDIKYRDINGDGTINDYDRVVLGRCQPIHTGGFNNNFVYGNLSLNIFFQWAYGHDIMNANRIVFEGDYMMNRSINQLASYADRWSMDNQDSKNYRAGGAGPRGFWSSRTIEDGSYLRLKTVNLTYSLPQKIVNKIKLASLAITVSGQNLWTWTNYSGLDPEVSTRHSILTPGFDYSAYPRNRIFSLGIKATF